MDALRVLASQRYGWDRFDALMAQTPWLFAGSSTLLAMAMAQSQSACVARHRRRQLQRGASPAAEENPSPTGRMLASVTSEREARDLITAHPLQLLVCTDQLAEGNGLALVRWLKRVRPAVKSVIVLHEPNAFKVATAWASQTDGLIGDPLAGEGNLLLALTTLFRGERFLDPRLATYLKERGLDWDPQLSRREQQVMTLVAEGLGDRAIAERMDMPYDTLKYVLKGVYGKLGAANRVQAAILLERMGVLRAVEW